MKKNITINLCGRLYQIDEDAYELLSHYTDTLRDYFRKQEGGEETADDIEERIAELFDDLKAQGIEAITIEHVQGVIERIGKVEEIAGEDAEFAESRGAAEMSEAKKPLNTKKFFRDSQNKILAGVLAGCAHYYGGSANGWRWGYVILCAIWCLVVGFGPITFSLPLEGIFGIVFLPILLLTIPFTVLPLLAYFLVAIFTPATQTAEDVLLMKGKEVNAQTLTEEVQEASLSKGKEKKSGVSFWDIFVGVICIGLSTALTIGLIVALCFFVAFLAASGMMADTWWNIDKPEDLNAIFIPAILSGILMLASIAILLYCTIHAAVSSFGKTQAMKTKRRVMWFLLWVVSVVGFVGCTIWAVGRLAKTQMARWDTEQAEWNQTHTDVLGHVFNRHDWDFFQQNGWELIEAENTDRYTYQGEWMTNDRNMRNDRNVRYLDADNENAPVVYTARKMEEVEPGIYRLSAAVRASNTDKYIYVYGQSINPETNDTTRLPVQLAEIPNNGNEGGNIHEVIGIDYGEVFTPDSVLKELVERRLTPEDRNKVWKANHQKGFGWNYVYVDSIRVEKPSEIFYGVSTDKKLTGKPSTTGWFSATDFRLEKIADL